MFSICSFNKSGSIYVCVCACPTVCVQLICSLMTLSTWCSAVEWLSVWINWRVGTGVWTGYWDWGAPQWVGRVIGTVPMVKVWGLDCQDGTQERWSLNIWWCCHRHIEDHTWRWFTKGGCLDTSKLPYLQHYLSLNITANWIIFFGGHPWPITPV